MRSSAIRIILPALGLAGAIAWATRLQAQSDDRPAEPRFAALPVISHEAETVLPPARLPLMGPDLALQVYQNRQRHPLPTYSAQVQITAVLPDTHQAGDYRLERRYVAPHTLQFTPVHFSGDGFVKSNVITRLLQAEVDHAAKDNRTQTAIDSQNYKFSYKGLEDVGGVATHVYHVKPRGKRPGLFKGRIFLDATTGGLRRVEGTMVKSPSFFVKRIEFMQDYAEYGGYMLPTYLHSVAKTRVVGRAVVDVFTSDYHFTAGVHSASAETSSQPDASN